MIGLADGLDDATAVGTGNSWLYHLPRVSIDTEIGPLALRCGRQRRWVVMRVFTRIHSDPPPNAGGYSINTQDGVLDRRVNCTISPG